MRFADQVVDAPLDLVADRAHLLERLARRVGTSQSSTIVGTYGQASPQPIVTAQSA